MRELRFGPLRQQTRVTYRLAPHCAAHRPTPVFTKTRSSETRKVERALQAQRTCEAEHGTAHTTYVRGES